MSIWDDKLFDIGDKVLTDICKTGRVINIRFDLNGERILSVSLDDQTATPDGLYIARDFELRKA